jgi:hypothetical protein
MPQLASIHQNASKQTFELSQLKRRNIRRQKCPHSCAALPAKLFAMANDALLHLLQGEFCLLYIICQIV